MAASTQPKHAGGRPPIYSAAIVKRARSYLKDRTDEIEEYHKTRGLKSDTYDRLVRVKLPTIEGLAVYLGLHRDTLYDWDEKHEQFSDILEELRALQADRLINGGLSGDYNPAITKVLLTKHGYVEKQETDLTSKGERIVILPSEIYAKHDAASGSEPDSSGPA